MSKSNKPYNSWVSFKNHVKNGKYVFSEHFNDFKNYCDWYINNPNFNKNDWILYRTLFDKKTKTLSADTLCFLPKEIVYCLNQCKKVRGKYPIGVTYNKKHNLFQAHMSFGNNKSELLGSFNNPTTAFNVYKLNKEKYIKRLTSLYVNELDDKVYQALMNYNIEITD